jgi:hypothetical protein
MSRPESAQVDLFYRQRLIAQLDSDLLSLRASGRNEAARYCEHLLALIADGAFDHVPPGPAHGDQVNSSPGTGRDGRYRAGRRWFEKKVRHSFSSVREDR